MDNRQPELNPPFQAVRNSLYSSEELLNGFSYDNPESVTETLDFKSYIYFVTNGRATPGHPYAGMVQSMHDNCIARAMFEFIKKTKKPAVGIMGGHREERGSSTYLAVTHLAKKLTEAGFLVASGGGPGAMEASHLGALFKGKSDTDVQDAVSFLSSEAALPNTAEIVGSTGEVSKELVSMVHKWAAPALKLSRQIKDGGQSLAVPSWHYGHEPLSPLATHVAKYFLNSIREDVLLALATNGIIFSPGRAGTLQEVFQDAAQNYYASFEQPFAPMIFFDTEFWTQTLPVEPLLKALFTKNGKETDYKENILFSDDITEIVDFLSSKMPSNNKTLQRILSLDLNF